VKKTHHRRRHYKKPAAKTLGPSSPEHHAGSPSHEKNPPSEG
jgi:hypothetical protein